MNIQTSAFFTKGDACISAQVYGEETFTDKKICSLKITFENDEDSLQATAFLHIDDIEYFRAVAAAINSVPKPVKLSEAA